RWLRFIGIIGGVLGVLAALAAVLRGRSRKAAALELAATERHEGEVADVLERRRIREEQHAVQKRAHEESVAAAAAARAKASAASSASPSAEAAPATVCPKCGRD